jgi:hypothetical protein
VCIVGGWVCHGFDMGAASGSCSSGGEVWLAGFGFGCPACPMDGGEVGRVVRGVPVWQRAFGVVFGGRGLGMESLL